jgi:type VI secretion system protein VasD
MKGILGYVVAATLLGCSAKPAPAAKEPTACQPTIPVLSVSASDRINPSAAGQPRPVQLRVYQLKSDAKLVTAKFEDIWQNDAAALEPDLVKVDEYTVFPGETKVLKVSRNADAHNLAAVALFREPQGKTWFLTYELEAPPKQAPCGPGESVLSISLDRMQMEAGQAPTVGAVQDQGSQAGAASAKGH